MKTIKLDKDSYIKVLELKDGWVTFHLYSGMNVWVKKTTLDDFNKKYAVEKHEQVLLF